MLKCLWWRQSGRKARSEEMYGVWFGSEEAKKHPRGARGGRGKPEAAGDGHGGVLRTHSTYEGGGTGANPGPTGGKG